jgi:hypothetical protein
MPDKSRDYELELFNVMNAIGDIELEMSEEELLDELRREGKDIEKQAEHVREAFRMAIREYRKAPLLEAQKKYEEHLSRIVTRDFKLPETAVERRNLLSGLFARKPEFRELLTAQHREFKDVTDADVESYLKQLIELGALESESQEEESEP